jgi:protein required for attachment to host cells
MPDHILNKWNTPDRLPAVTTDRRANMNIWFLVADAARARLFETSGKDVALTEVLDLMEPNARISETELASDEPGRQATAGGPGTHGMQEKVTPREQEDIRFAAELNDMLQEGINKGSYDELYIAAAPHFLGLLRKSMPDAVAARLKGDLDKDLTRLGEAEIREHLHAMM